ncbi:MAG: glycosyltransferase [Bacteroidetes bacterium]|nr:glycosyltransferase [Bacteroidota bacterium]
MRFLRDKGYDADLFVFANEPAHFHPSADSFDDEYKSYTYFIDWEKITDPALRRDAISEQLKAYNYTIACGLAPAFLHETGIKLNMFIPYGSDLYDIPALYIRYRHLNGLINSINRLFAFRKKFLYRLPKYLNRKLVSIDRFFVLYNQARNQFLGMKYADFMFHVPTNDTFESALKKIDIEGTRLNASFPCIYTPLFNPETLGKLQHLSKHYQAFSDIREKYNLVVFHHSRLQWRTAPDQYSWRGNDKLIKGFAAYAKKYPTLNTALVLLEYGTDVEATKQLIDSLGITDRVFWFEQMPRKELLVALNLFDIGCSGHFIFSFIESGSIYESLAMAKPLLHHLDKNLYEKDFPEVYPYLNVNDENDVLMHLENYAQNKEYYQAEAKKGKAWLDKYAIEQPLEKIMQIISAN